jgi:hypothetical protein
MPEALRRPMASSSLSSRRSSSGLMALTRAPAASPTTHRDSELGSLTDERWAFGSGRQVESLRVDFSGYLKGCNRSVGQVRLEVV